MTFIGVHCKGQTQSCKAAIAFQQVQEAPTATGNSDVELPFLVRCETCGETHSYGREDLVIFED